LQRDTISRLHTDRHNGRVIKETAGNATTYTSRRGPPAAAAAY